MFMQQHCTRMKTNRLSVIVYAQTRLLLITASELLNHGIQITEKWHHVLTTSEAKPRQVRGVANNLGIMSDSWERQVDARASGVPQELGK